jgi:hypothetical protein
MARDIMTLRSTLARLARTTWKDIEEGRSLGVPMGEVGITDRNMLALRREHPSLVIHKHAVNEEVRTGADWEWWLSTADGWLCLVFQAKVLDCNRRYPGITKGLGEGTPQVDALLRSCFQRSERLNGAVWPMYCFYNNWPGGWPENVPNLEQADPQAMSREDLQLYGCAVADAWSVRQILAQRIYSHRRTLRDSYLPVSRPWSMIFPGPADSTGYRPEHTLKMLSSLRYGKAQLESGHRSRLMELESNKTRRNDRGAIYRNPVSISQPPEYVLDLLEGTVKPRRLKPIARRVVILPESL